MKQPGACKLARSHVALPGCLKSLLDLLQDLQEKKQLGCRIPNSSKIGTHCLHTHKAEQASWSSSVATNVRARPCRRLTLTPWHSTCSDPRCFAKWGHIYNIYCHPLRTTPGRGPQQFMKYLSNLALGLRYCLVHLPCVRIPIVSIQVHLPIPGTLARCGRIYRQHFYFFDTPKTQDCWFLQACISPSSVAPHHCSSLNVNQLSACRHPGLFRRPNKSGFCHGQEL